jgi:hypothetical protein
MMVLVPRGSWKTADLARSSEPGTLIRGRRHYMEFGYGERREIGLFAKVDFWKAELAGTL